MQYFDNKTKIDSKQQAKTQNKLKRKVAGKSGQRQFIEIKIYIKT